MCSDKFKINNTFQKQKKLMSITISNCNQICNSPTNLSRAKMLYTFQKQPRFVSKNKPLCDKFYDMPDISGRSTSLGYGHKYDFTRDVPKSPPPTVYNLHSEFDKNAKKGVGFGEGRDEMAVTGPFMSTHKNKNPGPGNYQLKTCLSQTSYSMKGKNWVEDKEKLKLPGPGAYEPAFGLSAKGKYFLAKHKSSCVRNFNHSSKRAPVFNSITPGPGRYNYSTQEMSPEGKYFVSKMHNSLVRRFGTSVRQPLAPHNSTPGPGNYRLPSEFGYYVSKTAVPGSREVKVEHKQNEPAK